MEPTVAPIRDECRYTIARQMLYDTDSDVANVADLLDYADTSAFAGAFRRCSGTTPSLWRTRDEAVPALFADDPKHGHG